MVPPIFPVLAEIEAPDLGALRGVIITPPPVDAGPPRRHQPPAHPATDHTTGRIGRGRRGHVKGVESGVPEDGGGRLIPHALPGAVGALMVAVVEAPFPTALMPGLGGVHRTAAGQRPAARRAVGVAPVTRRTDRKEATAPAAGLLAEGLVTVSESQGDLRLDGETQTVAQQYRLARSVGGRGGHEGPEVPVRTLTYVCVHSYAIRNTESTPRQGLWTLPQVWTHTTRPHLLAKPPRGRFRTSAHSPSSSC